MYASIQAGAEGYLLKEDADTELFEAIGKIRQGGYYLSPLLSSSAAHELIQRRLSGRDGTVPEELTLREREVLTLIAEGKSSKEIAARPVHQHANRGAPSRKHHEEAERPQHRPADQIRHPEGVHLLLISFPAPTAWAAPRLLSLGSSAHAQIGTFSRFTVPAAGRHTWRMDTASERSSPGRATSTARDAISHRVGRGRWSTDGKEQDHERTVRKDGSGSRCFICSGVAHADTGRRLARSLGRRPARPAAVTAERDQIRKRDRKKDGSCVISRDQIRKRDPRRTAPARPDLARGPDLAPATRG